MLMVRASALEVAAAGDEDPADVVERVAAVVPVDGVALAEALPGAGPVGVERPHRLVRARVEGTAVRRRVDPRVQRQVQRRRGQPAQRSGRRPHLGDVRSALGDEHLAVAQRRDGRVPAPGRHVRAQAPRVRQVVEDVRLDDPVERRAPVPAGEEQAAVREVGQTAAEDVEAGDIHRACASPSRDPTPWRG